MDHIDWDRPILMGCCPSSGSTLLSVMLDAHPKIFCGPELALFSHPFLWSERGESWRERLLRYTDGAVDVLALPEWTLANGVCPWICFAHPANFSWYGCDQESMRSEVPRWTDAGDLVRYLFHAKLQSTGKSYWMEKTPSNLYAMHEFLDRYTHGRGIVMLRDGRDVVCSLLKRGFGFAHAAALWVLEAAMTLALGKHPRVHLVRYEDLVAEPRSTLERLMTFLQIDASIDDLLNYRSSSRARDDQTIRLATWKSSPQDAISAASVGRWREELSEFHLFVLENTRLKADFPGLAEMAGLSGRDILGAGGYALGEARPVDVARFGAWLAAEKSTLLSLAADPPFHLRHAAVDLNVESTPALALVPALVALAQEGVLKDARSDARAAELNEQIYLLRCELDMHLGLKNGVREAMRSAWRLIRRHAKVAG